MAECQLSWSYIAHTTQYISIVAQYEYKNYLPLTFDMLQKILLTIPPYFTKNFSLLRYEELTIKTKNFSLIRYGELTIKIVCKFFSGNLDWYIHYFQCCKLIKCAWIFKENVSIFISSLVVFPMKEKKLVFLTGYLFRVILLEAAHCVSSDCIYIHVSEYPI